MKKIGLWVLVVSLLLTAGWGMVQVLRWLGSANPAVAGPTITAFIGFAGLIYAQWHSKTRDIADRHRPKKIEVYDTFFDIVEHFMEQAKAGTSLPASSEDLSEKVEEQMRELTRGMVIWASPEVLTQWLKFRMAAGRGDKNILLIVDGILRAIRKDLGNSNFGLAQGAVIKMFLADPAEFDKSS